MDRYRSRKIQRANLDDSSVEDLVATSPLPSGIALDIAGGKMYWTTAQVQPPVGSRPPVVSRNTIQRANLNGSGVEELIVGLEHPAGIALDVAVGKMYWSTSGFDSAGTPIGTIHRGNLNGSDVEDLVTGLVQPMYIALDLTPIPEPSTFVLAALGLVSLLGWGRKQGHLSRS